MTSFALKFDACNAQVSRILSSILMLSTLVKIANKYLYNSGVLENAMKSCKTQKLQWWLLWKLPRKCCQNSLGSSLRKSEIALEIA